MNYLKPNEMDTLKTLLVSLSSFFAMGLVRIFTQQNVSFAINTAIGILTIIYLTFKIYSYAKRNRQTTQNKNP